VQLAQARYIYYGTEIMVRKASHDCVTQHLEGQALANALFKNVSTSESMIPLRVPLHSTLSGRKPTS
jgi:hypothetical protein